MQAVKINREYSQANYPPMVLRNIKVLDRANEDRNKINIKTELKVTIHSSEKIENKLYFARIFPLRIEIEEYQKNLS